MTGLQERSVLITGGSGDIGSATAALAAKKGWLVFIGYFKGKSRAEDLAKKLNAGNGKEQAWAVDFSNFNLDHVEKALDFVKSKTKILNAVVMAGSPAPVLAPFLKVKEEDFLAQFQSNVVFNHVLIAAAWKKFFRDQIESQLIGISSLAVGPPAWAHMSSYVMGKVGLETLLQSALSEFGSAGLRATSLRLGYTETRMLLSVHPHILEAARTKQKKDNFLDPSKVAHTVVELIENPPVTTAVDIRSLSA